jgi:hypothetical protein
MLSYNTLKDRPRDFLAATGLTPIEFQQWLPAFQRAYEQRYPCELTRAGKPRYAAQAAVPKASCKALQTSSCLF